MTSNSHVDISHMRVGHREVTLETRTDCNYLITCSDDISHHMRLAFIYMECSAHNEDVVLQFESGKKSSYGKKLNSCRGMCALCFI